MLICKIKRPLKLFLLFSLLLSLNLLSFSQTIKGRVLDAKTDEPLVGATIQLNKDKKIHITSAGLDGSFTFKNLAQGNVSLVINYVGYEPYKLENVSAADIGFVRLAQKATSLSSVIVNSTRGKETEEFARKREQRADVVLNIVSAKAIEISPDITIGNVLQRISGVSVTRTSNGDGQYAIIRGMSQRYNYTSVNGVILPSPDNVNRSVPMDIFPAEMIERLEVVKSLTPSMEGSAIAGASNLVMKNAPDKLVIAGNLGTGISSVFLDRKFSSYSSKGIAFSAPSETHAAGYVATPADFSVKQLNFHDVSLPLNLSAAVSIGNRIFKKKLGYVIAGSYSRQYRGGNTLFYNAITVGTSVATPNTVTLQAYQNRQYSSLQTRAGINAKFDYAFSADHTLSFYNLFLQLDDNQHRAYDTHGISPNNGAPLGEVDYADRVSFTRKNLYSSTLTMNDRFSSKLKLDWTVAYSIAKSATPDWMDFVRFKDSIPATTLYLSPLTHNWNRSKDEDKSAYLNFTYSPTGKAEFKVGAMYRYKDRNAFFQSYTVNPNLAAGLSRQVFTDVNDAQFNFTPLSRGLGAVADPQNYTGTEAIGAGFFEGKITVKEKFKIIAGVRVEITDQAYVSQQSDAIAGRTANIHYTDVLPSVNLKYALTGKQNLRASYFSGISRATLFELVPATSSGDYYNTGGDPNLKHTTSNNFDFRYENFFSPTSNIMAGVFYKKIINPIETANYFNALTQLQTYGASNPGGGAINYGLELVFTKFIQKWGVSGNYTYTHSSVTTLKSVSALSGQTATYVNQTRPLQGQSDHIGNLSLLYKNGKSGIDAQLSFVYTGKRIAIVRPEYNLDYWQRATSQLDFSFQKNFKKHFSVFVKITNLLNNSIYYDLLTQNTVSTNKYIPSQTNANKVLVQRDVFNQSYQAGLRCKL